MYKKSAFVISVFFTCNGHIFIKTNRSENIRFNKIEFNKVKSSEPEIKKFHPLQNHFNIKIDIPILLMVKLLLNNTLRKEIYSMLNYHVGSYNFNIDYDGSVYQIGNYYCRISSGRISDTKKMFFLL